MPFSPDESTGRDEPNSAPEHLDDARRWSSGGTASERQQARDLSRARDVLRNVPEMSEERLEEIKERIKRGYYKRSDVMERIARRISDRL